VAEQTAPPKANLERAQDEASRSRRRWLVDIGRRLIPQFWGITRTLGIYAADNETPHRALEHLAATLREAHEHDEAVAMIAFGDSAFVNGTRLRLDTATHRIVRKLGDFLDSRELGGISFLRGFRDDKLMEFLIALRDCANSEDPRSDLETTCAAMGITEIMLISPQRQRESAEEGDGSDIKLDALEAYVRAMYSFHGRGGADENAAARVRRQQVAVRRLMVVSERDENTFLQLGALRGVGDPVLDHTINTTVLALALGRRAGLARKHMIALGVSAMNHNIGEALPPGQDESAFLTREEVEEQHPLLGMRHLLEAHGTGPRILQRALVAAEHHRTFDGQDGTPDLPMMRPHLFSRMIAICDAYDAMIGGGQVEDRMPPDQAIKRLTRGSGSLYDPVLGALFVGMIGRYPPGALVELDNGDLAIVVRRGEEEDGQAHPVVLRIRDALGREAKPILLDLSERVPGKRRFKSTIVRTRDPRRLRVNVASYLFSKDALTPAERESG